MRALLLLVVGGTFLSCVITPAVYSLLEAHMTAVPWPYSRVFDRVALVVACALVWRLRGHLRLGSLRPYYQHWRRRGEYRRLLLGLLLTCSTALLAVPFVVASGAMYWHPRHGWQEVLERAVG